MKPSQKEPTAEERLDLQYLRSYPHFTGHIWSLSLVKVNGKVKMNGF
jgi:hypothetical protein